MLFLFSLFFVYSVYIYRCFNLLLIPPVDNKALRFETHSVQTRKRIKYLLLITVISQLDFYQLQPPAIASFTDTEIEECLKKPVVLHHPSAVATGRPGGCAPPNDCLSAHFGLLKIRFWNIP